jgi:anti-anti-sigma regulatory factor
VHSKRNRAPGPAAALREAGSRIAVFELQGDLHFGTAEALSRQVAAELDTTDYLLLDCRRVGHLDDGALEVLADLFALVDENKVVPVVASPPRSEAGEELPGPLGALRAFRDLDGALEWCEERVLEAISVTGELEETTLADQELLAGIGAAARALLEANTDHRTFAAGETVFSEGDRADRLYFLLSGRVSVELDVEGGSRRIASFGPGAAFGEMALLDEGTRSSSVFAEEESTCRVLTRAALAHLERADVPRITSVLYRNLACVLSRRLRETNEALRSLE